MKNLYTLTLVLLCAFVGKAQIINIPDAAFKARLVNHGHLEDTDFDGIPDTFFNDIDLNNNGEVEVSETMYVQELDLRHITYDEFGNEISYPLISSMEGINYFTNLISLRLEGNNLTSLDLSGLPNLHELFCKQNAITTIAFSTLTNLVYLDCSNNQITTLNIGGFSNLQYFSCINNQLSSLNISGLTNLQSIDCSHNQLTSLIVSSLTNLTSLNCNNNQLTSLNVSGLTNLQNIDCFDNQLISLNLSGTNLYTLRCSNNQLTILDVNTFNNLNTLLCSDNQITNLNVNGLVHLVYLYCEHNLISSLDVIGLPDLRQLRCSYNNLTSLNVNDLPMLQVFVCDFNQLSNLNVSGFSQLITFSCTNNLLTSLIILNTFPSYAIGSLDCSHNQLTSINVSGFHTVEIFFCEYNQLTTLDVSQLHSLYTFRCNNNQLTSLFSKNGVNEFTCPYNGGSSFANNPNLQYICGDEMELAFLETKIVEYSYTNCHVNSYCSFTPGGTFYTIQGNNHYDENNNGCDANDINLPNLNLTFSEGANTANIIPDASGNYHYDVQAGTHTFSPVFENPGYFNVSPTTASVTFPNLPNQFVQDFCITAITSHPDLEVVLIPIIGARPGFNAKYKIVYKNKGTSTQSGSVNLTFNDAVLDLVTATPAVSAQILNGLIWDFTNLNPFETREIVFTLNVNSPLESPAVNAGYVLNYNATISSTASETTPADNTFAFNQTVFNSFDPNDKMCLEGDNIALAKVGDYVHYVIHFQNDGTANAENIVVKDMIDIAKFDIATLIPENGSATYTTRITNTNQVEFVFQNINLPFAGGTNTGYVAFKIKTKPTLVLGNTFSNTASIYFDYNFPIITNTASTTIQALATQDFEFSNYFTLYPNPAKNVLNINTKSTIEVHTITIYNQLGQVVLAIPNAKNINTFDVSSLKTGNYFLKITSDKGSSTEKFLKQ